MRFDASNKHIIVLDQVLRGNGGGYVVGCGGHELCCGLTCDMLSQLSFVFSHNFLRSREELPWSIPPEVGYLP